MIQLYIPEIDDLWFKEKMLKDSKTMAFNHAYGGTIDFNKTKWNEWYHKWIKENNGKRFYRYLKDDKTNEFVGEAAYYAEDNHYIMSIIIYYPYRNKGYGTQGIELLCKEAKKNGIDYLYDNIAIDNSSIHLFLKNGFEEEYRNDEIILIKKKL